MPLTQLKIFSLDLVIENMSRNVINSDELLKKSFSYQNSAFIIGTF